MYSAEALKFMYLSLLEHVALEADIIRQNWQQEADVVRARRL